MSTPLNLLIVQDARSSGQPFLDELQRVGFAPRADYASCESDYLRCLNASLDVILADPALPGLDADRALELLHATGLDIVFIVVSGRIEAERAVDAIHQGAADYVSRAQLARLGPAVGEALERHRLRQKQLQSNRQLIERGL